MNCPSCGAPMRLANGNTSFRCDYCNTAVTIAPDDTGIAYLDPVAELSCPVCSNQLWNAVLARVQVHSCKQCQGLLVKMGALEPLVEAMRATHPGSDTPTPANPADLDRKIGCPQCHQRMNMDFYAGGGNVVVAGCEPCELNWLHGGVLMRIVRAPQTSDAEPAF